MSEANEIKAAVLEEVAGCMYCDTIENAKTRESLWQRAKALREQSSPATPMADGTSNASCSHCQGSGAEPPVAVGRDFTITGYRLCHRCGGTGKETPRESLLPPSPATAPVEQLYVRRHSEVFGGHSFRRAPNIESELAALRAVADAARELRRAIKRLGIPHDEGARAAAKLDEALSSLPSTATSGDR